MTTLAEYREHKRQLLQNYEKKPETVEDSIKNGFKNLERSSRLTAPKTPAEKPAHRAISPISPRTQQKQNPANDALAQNAEQRQQAHEENRAASESKERAKQTAKLDAVVRTTASGTSEITQELHVGFGVQNKILRDILKKIGNLGGSGASLLDLLTLAGGAKGAKGIAKGASTVAKGAAAGAAANAVGAGANAAANAAPKGVVGRAVQSVGNKWTSAAESLVAKNGIISGRVGAGMTAVGETARAVTARTAQAATTTGKVLGKTADLAGRGASSVINATKSGWTSTAEALAARGGSVSAPLSRGMNAISAGTAKSISAARAAGNTVVEVGRAGVAKVAPIVQDVVSKGKAVGSNVLSKGRTALSGVKTEGLAQSKSAMSAVKDGAKGLGSKFLNAIDKVPGAGAVKAGAGAATAAEVLTPAAAATPAAKSAVSETAAAAEKSIAKSAGAAVAAEAAPVAKSAVTAVETGAKGIAGATASEGAAVLEGASKGGSMLAKGAKLLGTPLQVGLAAMDEYQLLNDDTKTGKEKVVGTAGIVGGTAGGIAGGTAGASGGASLGATIGAVGGPLGIAAGGLIGGVLGGIGGYLAGSGIAESASKFVASTIADSGVGEIIGKGATLVMAPFSEKARDELVTGFKDTVLPVIDSVGKTFSDAGSAIGGMFSSAGSSIVSAFSSAGSTVASVLSSDKSSKASVAPTPSAVAPLALTGTSTPGVSAATGPSLADPRMLGKVAVDSRSPPPLTLADTTAPTVTKGGTGTGTDTGLKSLAGSALPPWYSSTLGATAGAAVGASLIAPTVAPASPPPAPPAAAGAAKSDSPVVNALSTGLKGLAGASIPGISTGISAGVNGIKGLADYVAPSTHANTDTSLKSGTHAVTAPVSTGAGSAALSGLKGVAGSAIPGLAPGIAAGFSSIKGLADYMSPSTMMQEGFPTVPPTVPPTVLSATDTSTLASIGTVGVSSLVPQVSAPELPVTSDGDPNTAALNALTSAVSSLNSTLGGTGSIFSQTFSDVGSAVSSAVQCIAPNVMSALSPIGSLAGSISDMDFGELMGKLNKNLKDLNEETEIKGQSMGVAGGGIWSSIKEGASSVLEGGKAAYGKIKEGYSKDGVTGAARAVPAAATDVAVASKKAVGQLATDVSISKGVAVGKWSPDEMAAMQAAQASGEKFRGGKGLDQETKDKITATATKHGIDPSHLMAMAQMESGGNAKAVSSTGAAGLFQFTGGTGKQYGITNRFDPDQNIDAAARLYKDNAASLKKQGIEPSLDNVYLAHQQGAGGAAQILKASQGQGQVSDTVARNMGLNVGGSSGSIKGFIDANHNALASASKKAQTYTADPYKPPGASQGPATAVAQGLAPGLAKVSNGASRLSGTQVALATSGPPTAAPSAPTQTIQRSASVSSVGPTPVSHAEELAQSASVSTPSPIMLNPDVPLEARRVEVSNQPQQVAAAEPAPRSSSSGGRANTGSRGMPGLDDVPAFFPDSAITPLLIGMT